MLLLNSNFYIAQAYGCDAYGQAAYNQCETTTPEQSTQNPQNAGGVGGDTGGTPQSSLQETATPEQSGDFLEPTQHTGQPSSPTEDTAPMDGVGFDLILMLAFIVALVIALIIFLFKRRRKHNDQFDDTFYTPSQ